MTTKCRIDDFVEDDAETEPVPAIMEKLVSTLFHARNLFNECAWLLGLAPKAKCRRPGADGKQAKFCLDGK